MPIDEEFMPSDGTESDYDMNEFTPDVGQMYHLDLQEFLHCNHFHH